jgi:hypothetical protein
MSLLWLSLSYTLALSAAIYPAVKPGDQAAQWQVQLLSYSKPIMAFHVRDDRLYEDLSSFKWVGANQDTMSQGALSQFNHPVLAV